MKRPTVYKTPLIVGWCLLAIGLLAAFNLTYMPSFVDDFDGMNGGFALIMFGVFLIVVAVVMLVIFGRLNRQFRAMLSGNVLVSGVLPRSIHAYFSTDRAEAIQSANKTGLFITLIFSTLIGLILGAAADVTFFYICLGIDAFVTLAYFVVTAFRMSKVRRPHALACLSVGGAYVFGELHSWSIAGAQPVEIDYTDGTAEHLPCPCIRVTYMAPAYPGPRRESITIPVVQSQAQRAERAVSVIRRTYGI